MLCPATIAKVLRCFGYQCDTFRCYLGRETINGKHVFRIERPRSRKFAPIHGEGWTRDEAAENAFAKLEAYLAAKQKQAKREG